MTVSDRTAGHPRGGRLFSCALGTAPSLRRSLSTPNGDTRTYQYGRADQNGTPTLTSSTRNGNRANIVNDAKTGQPIALSTPSDALGQYAYDGSGNPFALLTGSPAAFVKTVDPYGTDTVSYDGGGDGLPSNPFSFKAGIDDIHTGLVKFGQRWYNPYIGAWTQQDTLDSPLDPSNANRYAFAASDPINNSDPTGYDCGGAIFGAVTGVIASAASIAVIGTGVGGPIGAVGFAAGVAGTVYSVGDAINTCGS